MLSLIVDKHAALPAFFVLQELHAHRINLVAPARLGSGVQSPSSIFYLIRPQHGAVRQSRAFCLFSWPRLKKAADKEFLENLGQLDKHAVFWGALAVWKFFFCLSLGPDQVSGLNIELFWATNFKFFRGFSSSPSDMLPLVTGVVPAHLLGNTGMGLFYYKVVP